MGVKRNARTLPKGLVSGVRCAHGDAECRQIGIACQAGSTKRDLREKSVLARVGHADATAQRDGRVEIPNPGAPRRCAAEWIGGKCSHQGVAAWSCRQTVRRTTACGWTRNSPADRRTGNPDAAGNETRRLATVLHGWHSGTPVVETAAYEWFLDKRRHRPLDRVSELSSDARSRGTTAAAIRIRRRSSPSNACRFIRSIWPSRP